MNKYDIGTKATETFITVHQTPNQREQHEKSGSEPISWDYGLVGGHSIGRRRTGTNDEFLACDARHVPISVAAPVHGSRHAASALTRTRSSTIKTLT